MEWAVANKPGEKARVELQTQTGRGLRALPSKLANTGNFSVVLQVKGDPQSL